MPGTTPRVTPRVTPRATPPEIGETWREYKATGDVDLRNQLVMQYSPLVKYVAGRVRSGLDA